jgi:MFS family permease
VQRRWRQCGDKGQQDVGRTLAAIGGCAGVVLGRAIVRDVYDRERSASALATIMMVMSLTPSLSPAIGAYLARWVGWRADFVLLGAVGATVLKGRAAIYYADRAMPSVGHRPRARVPGFDDDTRPSPSRFLRTYAAASRGCRQLRCKLQLSLVPAPTRAICNKGRHVTRTHRDRGHSFTLAGCKSMKSGCL